MQGRVCMSHLWQGFCDEDIASSTNGSPPPPGPIANHISGWPWLHWTCSFPTHDCLLPTLPSPQFLSNLPTLRHCHVDHTVHKMQCRGAIAKEQQPWYVGIDHPDDDHAGYQLEPQVHDLIAVDDEPGIPLCQRPVDCTLHVLRGRHPHGGIAIGQYVQYQLEQLD